MDSGYFAKIRMSSAEFPQQSISLHNAEWISTQHEPHNGKEKLGNGYIESGRQQRHQ
jgi:hypothetical protein